MSFRNERLNKSACYSKRPACYSEHFCDPPEGRMQRGGTLGTEAQETRDYINSPTQDEPVSAGESSFRRLV